MKKESVFKRTQRKLGFPVKKTNFRKAIKTARQLMLNPNVSQSQAVKLRVVNHMLYGND